MYKNYLIINLIILLLLIFYIIKSSKSNENFGNTLSNSVLENIYKINQKFKGSKSINQILMEYMNDSYKDYYENYKSRLYSLKNTFVGFNGENVSFNSQKNNYKNHKIIRCGDYIKNIKF